MDQELKAEFQKIHQQFAKIDQRFAGIDQKFSGIDQKFAGIDQKFSGIDQKFAGIDKQFTDIKNFLYTNVATKADIAELEQKIPSKELIHNLYNSSDKLAMEVLTYRDEQDSSKQHIKDIEDWIDSAAPAVGIKFEH